MTKEEYLVYRENNDAYPMYYFYNKYHSGNKTLLNKEEFFHFIRLYPFGQECYEKVITYYDHFFEVSILQDLKTGNIIKYL